MKNPDTATPIIVAVLDDPPLSSVTSSIIAWLQEWKREQSRQ